MGITQPPNLGSQYFNYKKFFSIVFMMGVDAVYKFVYVNVGAHGTASESSVFQSSYMVKGYNKPMEYSQCSSFTKQRK